MEHVLLGHPCIRTWCNNWSPLKVITVTMKFDVPCMGLDIITGTVMVLGPSTLGKVQ